jgi:ribose 5-phosphate isomerase A
MTVLQPPENPVERGKYHAAKAALELVDDGMVLGLGTGSTAAYFVKLLAERVQAGLNVSGAPTSEATEKLARECGVPIIDFKHCGRIDLTVDGADEFDPHFRLIKGGGAALLREKIIADFSEGMAVITDSSKKVRTLGRFPLPVEVTQFGLPLTEIKIREALRETGCAGDSIALRVKDGAPLKTDGGHFILDCRCEAIPDPDALATALSSIPGVMEHGLFIGIADVVIVGDADGAHLLRKP